MDIGLIGVLAAIGVEAVAIVFWSGRQYEFGKTTREQVTNLAEAVDERVESLEGDTKELQSAINNHLSGIDTNMKTIATDMATIKQVVQDLPCKNHTDSIKDVFGRMAHQEGIEKERGR